MSTRIGRISVPDGCGQHGTFARRFPGHGDRSSPVTFEGGARRMSAPLPTPQHIDPARIAELMERERARLHERTKQSGEYFKRASAVMPGGVPSQFQKNDPWPTYLTRGQGAKV